MGLCHENFSPVFSIKQLLLTFGDRPRKDFEFFYIRVVIHDPCVDYTRESTKINLQKICRNQILYTGESQLPGVLVI